MASSETGSGYSVTPTQPRAFTLRHNSRKSDDLTALQRPSMKDGRSLSGGSSQYGSKAFIPTLTSTGPPGSFNPELKGAMHSGRTTPQTEAAGVPMSRLQQQAYKDVDGLTTPEQRQAAVREKIAKEMKIKLGTENMLEALLSKNPKQTKEQRQRVEMELGSSNRKLAELKQELDQEIQRAQTPSTPPNKRMTSYFRGSPLKSPPRSSQEETEPPESVDVESPTVVLTEILQQLEADGMNPDYYIERANRLVDLLKRNPTLKYDLAWSVFSLRVQLMLLSDSSDVVAAGYRLTRHAIADRKSLQTIRTLHTDELVILSLVKKNNATLEREQAVKFVRAFLDVKEGVYELSRAVVRSLVAVAEAHDDNLKDICLLTLAELLMKHTELVVAANGVSTLTDALADGSFPAPEGLVASFLHILDHPRQRRFLHTGREFEAMFAPFTDPLLLSGNEEKLKTCAQAIAAMLKTWPGYLLLSMNGATPLRSLIDSLVYPISQSRDTILELFFDILRIKPPSWSTSYLAGRRLTTYGRLNTLPLEQPSSTERQLADYNPNDRFDLTQHFSAFVLAALIKAGLVPALVDLIKNEEDLMLKRKSALLLTEVLKLANNSLPQAIGCDIQVLGDLVPALKDFGSEMSATNMSLIYQIESINRTLQRSSASTYAARSDSVDELAVGPQAVERSRYTAMMDSDQFRQAMADSQVTSHSQYVKWKWELIHGLVEGPLTNPKRLEEAIKSPKFLKRLVGFYRPFKYRFSMIRNTRPNQRYVRTGCALMKTLTQTTVGIQYLAENKLLRQIAECLAQVDPHSGITSASPLFDRHHMAETLSGGYFAMLGALSHTIEGIRLMEQWHMMDIFYHLVELKDRDDLIRALLGNMDYTLDTHLRVILSKALTSGVKDIRLFSTRLLRRYAVGRVQYSSGLGLQDPSSSHWALRLVLTQLYDPDVEVCEVAIKILEQACNQRSHLEYVVKCRPSLDHLGEIGAPLLLRFLSTSVGYRYLSGLDYITQEMDDWFLGRNDAYVALVEASILRAYMDGRLGLYNNKAQPHDNTDPAGDLHEIGVAPPHFYRELARTQEGCRLLRQSGHFYEFSSTIRDFRLDEDEAEALTKVKGCLWAVGNIGSMDLGATFLEEADVVKAIVRIAQGAEVMSMRGTACFVLGLISRTLHGFEMLAENGWDTAVDPQGRSLGLCLPLDLNVLCLKSVGSSSVPQRPNPEEAARYKAAVTDTNPVRAKILKNIVEMGNSVMYKKAAGELQALKAKEPSYFADTQMFRKTLVILESHHYRLQARHYILNLFNKGMMRRIIFDEEMGESESSSDTG
ncbi:Target of rapamycin complex 2 subunit ste20 [Exophiala dermatitidis]